MGCMMIRACLGVLADSSDNKVWHVVVATSAIGALLVVAALVIQRLRRHVRSTDRREDGTRRGGFSMEELEQMRRQGKINDAEFRTLRRAALGLGVLAVKTDDCASSAPAGAADEDSTPSAELPCAGGDDDTKE